MSGFGKSGQSSAEENFVKSRTFIDVIRKKIFTGSPILHSPDN